MKKRLCMALLFCSLVAFLPRGAAEGKQIELILDASGSMNGRLSNGSTKLAAALEALETVVAALPEDTVIAFRAYGHQSPRAKHDCGDTQLLVPFGPAPDLGSKILQQAKKLKAQGYTPITRVITIAAGEFPAQESDARIIILVSDGKETCEGDPCAAARALAEAGTQLVIHTVGFDVDEAARGQLMCISSKTGGQYYDAADAQRLAEAIGAALESVPEEVEPEEPVDGKLTIKGADLTGHTVTDADSGEVVGNLSHVKDTITLPAGIYNVTFAGGIWKSVAIEGGETTVLEPGFLKLENAYIKGHRILDSETGQEQGQVSSLKNSLTLLPGLYDITFGKAVWPYVKISAGETTALVPGTIQVKWADIRGHVIRDADGNEVGSVGATQNWMPLPPGNYTVDIDGKQREFTIEEGVEITLERSGK